MTVAVNILTYDRLNKPTGLSIDAPDAVTNPQIQALADAIDAIILGSDVKATKTTSVTVDVGGDPPSTDKDANRGNKWLFRSKDSTTGKIYTNEIGTADNAILPSADSDFLDLTTDPSPGKTLKTAWDAVYISPAGNAGILLSVQQVNRALN